jgi:DNA replication protein DnaC
LFPCPCAGPDEESFQPKLDNALVIELARLDFVRRREDLVITGKSGTGKSHSLKAFGLRPAPLRAGHKHAL